ncbi:MAG: glycerol-3-phosphate 1-O-acyltransferase PlsY [Lachnospiraceae bacterium]|nr:glycerol-3-phosphate 1-O-acyltransferase PlsY [Lachnospiraceae bacterium]
MILGRVIGLVLGYVFGLFPTGVLMGKAHKTDLKKEGSGNTGMTNSIRVLGWKAGVIVFAGDFFKAVIAMVIIWAVYRNVYPEAVKLLMLYAGMGAVLGHNYPVYARFKGGKGIACSIGTIIAFDWRMAPICAVLFFLTVVPTGFMSLGSLGIVSGFFVQTIVFGQLGFLKVGAQFLPELYVIAAILTALAFIQHRGNLKRLATGTENKFAPSKNKKKETED